MEKQEEEEKRKKGKQDNLHPPPSLQQSLLLFFFPPEGRCVSECPDGFYADEDSNDCEECHSDCVTCDGPEDDDCLSCEDGKTLENGECVSDHEACPIKTFLSGETNTYISLIHLSALNESGIWTLSQGAGKKSWRVIGLCATIPESCTNLNTQSSMDVRQIGTLK